MNEEMQLRQSRMTTLLQMWKTWVHFFPPKKNSNRYSVYLVTKIITLQNLLTYTHASREHQKTVQFLSPE